MVDGKPGDDPYSDLMHQARILLQEGTIAENPLETEAPVALTNLSEPVALHPL
ncbi:MAG: hypothetical protein GX594_02010 [Pirellulaceae bacterium]|nr:hypothetical protein [Pirellulaceae bacterium]